LHLESALIRGVAFGERGYKKGTTLGRMMFLESFFFTACRSLSFLDFKIYEEFAN
jgi:hypothetical protein